MSRSLLTEEVPSFCQRPAHTCAMDVILPCFCKDFLPSLFCASTLPSNAPGLVCLKILLAAGHTPLTSRKLMRLLGICLCLCLLVSGHSLCPHLISPLPSAGATSPLKPFFLRSPASSTLANPMVAFLSSAPFLFHSFYSSRSPLFRESLWWLKLKQRSLPHNGAITSLCFMFFMVLIIWSYLVNFVHLLTGCLRPPHRTGPAGSQMPKWWLNVICLCLFSIFSSLTKILLTGWGFVCLTLWY